MKRFSDLSILLSTFASVNKSVFIMKIKLTTEQIQKIAENPVKASQAKIKVSDPWWLIVIKVIAYICGLILAGATTASCAAAAVTAF